MRQKILVLYLHNSDLNSRVVAWSLYDGAAPRPDVPEADNRYGAPTGSASHPPYASVVDAMRDGWRVVQFPQQFPAYPGMGYDTSFLKYEFILEKLEDADGSARAPAQ
ncbi:MAG: hypothetical protein OXE53_05945 [Deltaproteobacteria bacterium]|nr:hypothetical protein [Deltaproteobacteria bacterium]